MTPSARRLHTLAALALALLWVSGSAQAWKGASAGMVVSIAEVREKAEMGDLITIEGTVKFSKEDRYFRLSDGTGEMVVLIPNHVARESGIPERDDRIRVTGAFDREKLDKRVYGVRVQSMERLGRDTGARGNAAPTASSPSPTPPPARVEQSAPDSGESGEPSLIQPQMERAWVERLRTAMREYVAAVHESEEARSALASALYEAGTLEATNPAVVERERRAQAEFERTHANVRQTVVEAREAGVSPKILRLYEQASQNVLR
ncbi:MAG: NirD/YgiW/YdeI family stress tolerance protein [Myxococcota bacterium]